MNNADPTPAVSNVIKSMTTGIAGGLRKPPKRGY